MEEKHDIYNRKSKLMIIWLVTMQPSHDDDDDEYINNEMIYLTESGLICDNSWGTKHY